eukprot:CAMPEP_0182951228 /NCGR_PEP_ID=MMETSP0105_2-20130417/61167_1 /TAXON_ID=81532 ORGANISM="Acanthoeca-like sp., Strain 10tr" /NCGR_SAMPLE_ID=MMETSP0105_2 /ASSEMBLY_ACC=CAM_ASM_000205 /LENGTH=82 /DNA_ID=CAMNT_0025091541 /DNA_START=536 /DNA_END=784 /DNA_ORIENTATION=-
MSSASGGRWYCWCFSAAEVGRFHKALSLLLHRRGGVISNAANAFDGARPVAVRVPARITPFEIHHDVATRARGDPRASMALK